ncbi:MAG: hypothetical protein ABIO70_12610 [Pseudomonadota bacterium]
MTYRHPLRVRALASTLLVARVAMLRLGDRAWVLLLRTLLCLPLPTGVRAMLGEVCAILDAGPPGPALLRRMVAGTTREELEDLLWGATVFDERVLP